MTMEPDLMKYILREDIDAKTLFSNKSETEKLVTGLKEKLSTEDHYQITDVELISHNQEDIIIRTNRFGHYQDNKITGKRIESAEWTNVTDLWKALTSVVSLPIKIDDEKKIQNLTTIVAFMSFFMEGVRGAYNQRYKVLER